MKRLSIVLGSVVLTGLILYLALMLGAWGFETRRYSQHQGRLSRLLAKQPRLEQVVQGLQDEGSPLLAAPKDMAELERLAGELGGARRGEILEQGRRWPQARVFRAGDMLYFLFFDADGVMRGFACVSP